MREFAVSRQGGERTDEGEPTGTKKRREILREKRFPMFPPKRLCKEISTSFNASDSFDKAVLLFVGLSDDTIARDCKDRLC